MKHGLTRKDVPISIEYKCWLNMRSRCNNPKATDYRLYGGKGITVCERWNDYRNFIKDMGPMPSVYHSLDRIDSSKSYEPSNCRWATWNEQALNRWRNKV